MSGHTTVLCQEAVQAVLGDRSGLYIDGTYGRGGHSAFLLQQLEPTAQLLAFDRDPDAAACAQHSAKDSRFTFVGQNFTTMDQCVAAGTVDGIVLDLGVSSPQLDDAARGFSFQSDGPLDMRMDTRQQISAASWLSQVTEVELGKVLREYGEERFWRRIARTIVTQRTEQPLTTTRQLAELVATQVPRQSGKHQSKHPATRVFQAIRIAVNQELDALQAVLQLLPTVLRPGGKAAVISFHSLEDRFVKHATRPAQLPPRGLPLDVTQAPALRQCGKVIKASEAEVHRNPRSRSAVLRVLERAR